MLIIYPYWILNIFTKTAVILTMKPYNLSILDFKSIKVAQSAYDIKLIIYLYWILNSRSEYTGV